MRKHFSMSISGLVQGVWFRASTKQKADTLGIVGLVRNEPDGSVYVEAEGEEENLRLFKEWCQRGPANARVEKFDLMEGALKNFQDFVIKR